MGRVFAPRQIGTPRATCGARAPPSVPGIAGELPPIDLDRWPAALPEQVLRVRYEDVVAGSEQVRQPIIREGLDQWRNYEPWLGPLKDALGDARVRYRQ